MITGRIADAATQAYLSKTPPPQVVAIGTSLFTRDDEFRLKQLRAATAPGRTAALSEDEWAELALLEAKERQFLDAALAQMKEAAANSVKPKYGGRFPGQLLGVARHVIQTAMSPFQSQLQKAKIDVDDNPSNRSSVDPRIDASPSSNDSLELDGRSASERSCGKVQSLSPKALVTASDTPPPTIVDFIAPLSDSNNVALQGHWHSVQPKLQRRLLNRVDVDADNLVAVVCESSATEDGIIGEAPTASPQFQSALPRPRALFLGAIFLLLISGFIGTVYLASPERLIHEQEPDLNADQGGYGE